MAEIIQFNKKWLLALVENPPAVRTEYKDSVYVYLRARVTPKGHVTLSVRKNPRWSNGAIRRLLRVNVDEHMPAMSQVRAMAADVVREIDSGEVKRGAVPLLADGLQSMLSDAELKPRTIAGYTSNVNKHLVDWKLKPMTGDANAILKMHRKISKESGPVAANNALRTYRRILNVCAAKGENVPEWPAAKLNTLKLWAPEVARTKRRLSRDDFPIVWAALDTLEPMWGDLMRFWLLTGCRRREATGLTVKDVDFRRNAVTFRDTKNKSNHTLPLTDTLTAILNRRKKVAQDGFLFPCSEPKNITRRLEKATGIHVTPHDCRRTFAALAEISGVGSHTVSVLLNHTLDSVTAGYIGELDDRALRKALENIEKTIERFAAENACV